MDEQTYLDAVRAALRGQKKLADGALAQASDAEWFAQLDADSNSLAILVKHVAGNLRSHWRDFLTTDGEKPDRQRDSEFVIEPGDTRETLLARWDEGWRRLFETLGALTAADLERTVTIRGEPHTVPRAIERAVSHTAHHVGQIVFLARHLAGPRWRTLSIPRGKSEEFTAAVRAKAKTEDRK